jgi:hypothetical protein
VLSLLAGERVVEAQRAADHEAAVGDVVDFARGPFFDLVIDDEGADVKGLLLRGGAGGVRGEAVGDVLACADADCMGLGSGSGMERQRKE